MPFVAQSPLLKAVHVDSIECVRELLNAGADVNKGDGTSGRTPLHHTVQSGNIVSTAELLLCVSLILHPPTYACACRPWTYIRIRL